MKLNVFYNEKQTVRNNKSLSPSAGKPELVANLFKTFENVNIISEFSPLTRDQIGIAHNQEFVNGILDCLIPNGFQNRSKEVADSLHWTTGSMHAAALDAILNKSVAMSPTSGFHHARFNGCEGFCTFNGLMISALLLKKENRVNKVGIVDFDCHYGNGTDDIIEKLKVDWITHYTFGDFAESIKYVFDEWLEQLPEILKRDFANVDLIYYQAGADPHINDPFGGYLTTEQMRIRDKVVFEFAENYNIPIAWNLAGGYQTPIQKVLSLHENTLKECIKAYSK